MSLQYNSGRLPQGFLAAGISAGIKRSKKKDLALLFSPIPCVSSGMLTANLVKAAPLIAGAPLLRKGRIQAVIVNSGNANCMTGARGVRDAIQTARAVENVLGLAHGQVLVSSTGIIGRPLPLAKITEGVPALVRGLSYKGLSQMAEAILTTDRFTKEVSSDLTLGGRLVRISGVAKGAGMVAPRLATATMLAYIASDVAVTKPVLDVALREAVGRSFNAITVDGCMSTNDTVVVLANGCAGNRPLAKGSKDAAAFTKALTEVCEALAKMIVRDGEGATKFITIDVRGCRTTQEAERLAFSVANSSLFKCAMFGSDANWGRIAAALGSVPSHLDWERLDISMNTKFVFRNGKPVTAKDRSLLRGRDVGVLIDLHQGVAAKRVYTTDLSYGYVRINADYN